MASGTRQSGDSQAEDRFHNGLQLPRPSSRPIMQPATSSKEDSLMHRRNLSCCGRDQRGAPHRHLDDDSHGRHPASSARARDPSARAGGFEPNALIFSTFRFDPGRSAPHQGDIVRLVDRDQSQAAPRTLTIVRQSELPTTFDEVLFGCEACNRALDAHFATQPPTRRVGLGNGLNAIGDSMLIFPGQSIQAPLTALPARPGTSYAPFTLGCKEGSTSVDRMRWG